MRQLSRLVLALTLAIATLTLGGAAARASTDGPAFSLRPVRFDPNQPATKAYFIHTTAAGQQVQDDVLVRNSGTAVGTVRLYAVDGVTGTNSGTVFLSDTDPPQDVAAWITLGTRELTLGPGEERIVPFTVTVPADAAVGQHLGGLVAEGAALPQSAQPGVIQIKTRNRMIAAVQVNLPGSVTERISVTGVTSGGTQGEQTILLGLRNDGSEMVKPTGTLIITNGQGREVQRLTLKLDTFVPRTAIQYPVAVQREALGAGQYRARVDLTYGTSGVTSYEDDLTISAAQVAQVFPSAVALAPPPGAANGAPGAPATTVAAARAQWPLIVGGGALLVLVLVGGIFLGQRGRPGNRAK